VIESVKQASKRASLGGMRILLENTAGMGTCLSSRLEEMAEILEGLAGFPVDVCLDTAHLFASGYDIRSEEGLAATIGQIDQTIGLERVPVMHINDSKIPLGGRVDRHEHIGRGKIGAEAFRRILTHPRLSAAGPEGLAGRAFILETPIDDPGDDRKNVAALWELAGLKDTAPVAEKGFSMLTASLKKKMDAQRAVEKRSAAAVARRNAGDGGAIEERSLRSTGRLLRPSTTLRASRSEAGKKMHRPVPVGMTGGGGATGGKVIPIATKFAAKTSAPANKNSASGTKKSGAAKNKAAKNKAAKNKAAKNKAGKKAGGAKRRRG
jgi:hypothetical protein